MNAVKKNQRSDSPQDVGKVRHVSFCRQARVSLAYKPHVCCSVRNARTRWWLPSPVAPLAREGVTLVLQTFTFEIFFRTLLSIGQPIIMIGIQQGFAKVVIMYQTPDAMLIFQNQQPIKCGLISEALCVKIYALCACSLVYRALVA